MIEPMAATASPSAQAEKPDQRRTVSLWPSEIEAVVRWLVSEQFDLWRDAHHDCYGSGATNRSARAIVRSRYFEQFLGSRMEEIEREAWREQFGECVKACDCWLCTRDRPWLYPGMDERAQAQLESPPWQAVAAEAHRQFPEISPGVLDRFLKREIRCGHVPSTETVAVKTVIEGHTHTDLAERLHLPIAGGNENEVGSLDAAVREVLDQWRGERAVNRGGVLMFLEAQSSQSPLPEHRQLIEEYRSRGGC